MLGRYLRISLILLSCLIGMSIAHGQTSAIDREVSVSTDALARGTHISLLERAHNIVLGFNSAGIDMSEEVLFSSESLAMPQLLAELFDGYTYRVVSSSTSKILLVFEGIEIVDRYMTIRGKVFDSVSREALISATIHDEVSNNYAFTNEEGFYSIEIRRDSHKVVASYLGYQLQAQTEISASAVDFYLSFDNEVDSITISSKIERGIVKGSGGEKLNAQRLETIRGVTGEKDIIGATKVLPGVQSGNEGQTGFYVRGGSPDQNLILLDGIPMYEVSHTVGLSSIFIDESIKDVEFLKNGFPARYGGRLSSVLSVTLKEGNKSEYHGAADAGLYAAKFQLEGPLVKDQTSFNISGRRSLLGSYLNDVYTSFTEYDEIEVVYYDITAKLSHNFSPASKVTVSYYSGRDDFGLLRDENFREGEDRFDVRAANNLNWGSTMLNAQFSTVLNNNLFMKVSLGGNNYRFNSNSDYFFESLQDSIQTTLGYQLTSRTDIVDYIASTDLDYTVNDKHRLKFGGSYTIHSYRPQIQQGNAQTDSTEIVTGGNDNLIPTEEFGLYIEDTYTISENWQAYFGLHYSGFRIGLDGYRNLQPRFRLFYRPSKKDRLDFAYTSTAQYIHLLVNPGTGLPSDLWVPSTADIEPETARQVSASYTRQLGPSVSVKVGGYYKQMTNVLEYRSPVDLIFQVINTNPVIDTSGWESRVVAGSSSSRGLEVQADYVTEKWQIWSAYTLSKTDRTFASINNGNPFPYRYDRRHDINVGVGYTINPKWSLSGRWVYGDGAAFSLSLEEFETIGGLQIINGGERNNFKLPAFHHLDLQVRYLQTYGNGHKLKVNFGMYNSYNRLNSFYVYIFENPLSGDKFLRKVSIFPILPHLNMSYVF